MSVEVGITEKRLANRKFKRTEEAILRVFFETKSYISIGKMAVKAGVARSTVYNHHRTVWEITTDYKEYILRKYQRLARKIMKAKNLRLRMVFVRILYFILADRKIFEILIKDGRVEIFEEMLVEIQPKLAIVMRLPKNSQTLFAVYKSEVARLIYEWGSKGFDQNEMKKILDEILYLTETARERLKILLD